MGLNIRTKNIKLLDKNIGKKTSFGSGKDFLDMKPKVQQQEYKWISWTTVNVKLCIKGHNQQ